MPSINGCPRHLMLLPAPLRTILKTNLEPFFLEDAFDEDMKIHKRRLLPKNRYPLCPKGYIKCGPHSCCVRTCPKGYKKCGPHNCCAVPKPTCPEGYRKCKPPHVCCVLISYRGSHL